MKNLFSVQDKVIVITGAAGVLGTSMVHHFAEQGAKVVILDRNEEAGRRLEEEVKAEGGEVMFLYTDVLDKQVLEGNYTEIMARYGRIADSDEMLMIDPCFCSIIARVKVMVGRIIPNRFRSTTLRTASMSRSKIVLSGAIVAPAMLPPAPLISTSIRP